MKQLKQLLLVMAIALTGFTPAQAQTPWTHYSEWMANTQKSYVYINGSKKDYWRYDDGLMYESILDTYEHYKNGGSNIGDETLKIAVKAYIDECINSDGTFKADYKSGDLDDIRPARMVYKYYKLYGGSNLLTACQTVMACNAFKDNARVISQSTGYPWQHKADYTEQVWLDGIFMGLPYWTLAGPDAEIGSSLHSSWSANDFFNDAVSQMQKTDEKTYEPTIGLWCHAWDATEPFSLFWSTKNKNFTDNTYSEKHSPYEIIPHDGRSSHCWGRALGWYAMAIMETMDNIAAVNGAADSRITTLKALFKKVMDKVVETRDPSEGVWHCVIDVDATQAPYKDYSTKNNYLEATCSAMFTYCLLHGVAQGYLDSSYLPVAKDAYNKFITKFIDGTGTNLIMSNCMSVGGLGPGENYKSPNYKRDGSYAYYMSESIVSNDSKGVGPFIWASLEAEKTYGYTIKGGFSKPVVSDDIVQFRWSRIADDFTVPGTTPSSFVSPTFTAKTLDGTAVTTGLSFSSDNEAVATVANDGTITLEGGEGTANITATMTNGNYAGSAIYTVTTTGTDTTKPTFVSSTPATNATDVAVSGNIVLTFSEAVTIADASKITLIGGSGTLDKEHATTDGATITIPYSGLANSTNYTLNIDAGAVKDLADNTNDELSDITFTTIAPDETAPTLKNQSIENNATNVSTSGTIVLTFSEDVTCTTNATLTTTGSSAINLTPTVSGSTVTYSYSGLSNSTSYTFNLPANSVADLSGNKYASAISFSFTTGAAPTHTASDPAVVDKSNTGTYGNKIFLDVANTESNTTITTGNVSCLTYNWKDSNNKNWYEGGTSGTNTETWSGFVNEGFPDGSSISSASVKKSSNIRYYYVTGTTGVAILGKSNNDTDRKLQLIVEEVAENGVLTAKGTTAERLNSSIGVLEHSFSMDATKYYRITIKGSSEDNGRLCAIRFKQGSSTPAEDTTPPTVTMTTPSATTDVAITTSSVVLTVSEEVTAVGEDIAGTFNGSAITFTRTDATHLTYNLSNLTNSTTYNIQLNANQIRDAAGNKNAETNFSFTTVAAEQEQVATPSITGTTPFTDNTTATITCTTTGATIHYTTDGSAPTSSSATYSEPINISATTTVKAIAVKTGMTDSEVASQTFTKSSGGGGTSATITYNLKVGTSASTTIKNSTSTTDATNITNIDIDQEHDGANGEGASDRTTKLAIKTGNNGETFNNPTNYELFKFTIATGKQFTPSEIAIKVANVGSTSANKVKYKATLTDESSHSIDGTYVVTTGNGTVEDFKFSNSSNVAFTGNVTLKLWAWTTTSTENNASAFRMGTPLTITGTIEDSGEPIIPTYTVTATSNNNSWGTVSVDKATAAEGATVTITTSPASGYELTSLTATDGESNPVTITNNQFTMPASNVTVNATFAAMEKVATPSITGTTPFTDNTSVTITCATDGATIYYTTDGTAPTSSSTEYTEAIPLTATTTIKAIAIKDGMTDSEVASATFTKSGGGGGGSGTVLFSQDFNNATEIAYAASTARTITTGSGNNIVGTDNPSTKFTSITCNAKNTTGIGINSTTGGNNKDYTGKFGAFYNNTEAYWSIVKSTKFVSTAPTAIKVVMNAAFSNYNGSGSDIGVQFAIGSGFKDGLTNSCPALTNCVAGFALPHNSSIKIAKYSTSNSNSALSGNNTLTAGTSYTYTWIINNTNESLTYTDPTGTANTVAANCWDLWVGNTRYCAGITKATTGMSGTSLENIYIGSPFGKKHEFILDDIVVTDLSPAAMRTTTATIKAGKQYATFNTTMDIDFDETDGLQAFVVDNATKSSVHLREVTVVPANTALIIKGAPDTYTLYETKKATESVSDNQLTISNSTVAADNMYYALGTVNGVQGFHRVQNGLTIPTSYVIITDQTAKSFLNFEEEENIATGIDGFATDNGFIVIDDNTPLYNLSGQRVSKSYKGIVIVNGKKVLRK